MLYKDWDLFNNLWTNISLLRLDLFYFFVTIPGTALSDYFNIEGSLLVHREKTKTLPSENRVSGCGVLGLGRSVNDSGVPEGSPLFWNSQTL